MTQYRLINHDRGTEKDFETKEAAEERKQEMGGLGAPMSELEIVEIESEPKENGEEPTSDDGPNAESESEAKEPEPVATQVDTKGDERVTGNAYENLPEEHGTVDIESEEQFVKDIKGVPETFVVDMGGSPHIRKEGYYYLAAEMGLEIQTEPLNPTWEGDSDTASWRGVVRDGDKEWSNVGTAHLQHEDMQGAAANLDELAATRAACRSLSMATGTGIASMEEMIGDPE